MAQTAEECKANPSRPSQYQFVPEEYRIAHELTVHACVCRSKHCKRTVGLLGSPGKPGRKAAKSLEDIGISRQNQAVRAQSHWLW